MLFLLISLFLSNSFLHNQVSAVSVSYGPVFISDTTGHKNIMDSIGSMLASRDTSRIPDGQVLSLKDFGAAGDGKHDDIEALEHARDWVIRHPAILTIPIG